MFSNQSFKTALNHASRIAVQRRDDGLLLGTDSSLPVDTRFVRENTFTPRNASFNIRHFLSNKKNRPFPLQSIIYPILHSRTKTTLLPSLLHFFHPSYAPSIPFLLYLSFYRSSLSRHELSAFLLRERERERERERASTGRISRGNRI